MARIDAAPEPEAPETADPRIPPRDRVVTRALIDRFARETRKRKVDIDAERALSA